MEFLRNKRILAIIGIVCLFVGTITPYFQFPLLGYSYSISLWRYWEGKIVVALIVLNTMFIFKDFLKKYVPQVFNSNLGQKIENANPKLSIIPTILIVLFVVYLAIHLNIASEYIKHGLGFYALWLGIIALVAHAFLYKNPSAQGEVSYNQNHNNPSINQNVTMSQPIQQQSVNSMQNAQGNVKYCPQCGNQVDGAATQCFMCGHHF